MKNAVIIFIVIFYFSAPIFAQNLEAKPMSDVLSTIENAHFEFKEHALFFGFNSLHSCLYTGSGIAILKHYCYPEKNYPAKGYKIISTQFGVIDLYEEQFANGPIKRDILISTFSETLKPYLNFNLESSTVQILNPLIETLYYKNTPTCWSSNYSFSTRVPEVSCRAENVGNLDSWSEETQALTASPENWQVMVKRINAALRRSGN